MKKPAEFASADAWRKYEAYLEAKKEANRAYRANRTKREQEAIAAARKAAAVVGNRDIDPTREEWLMRAATLILKHVAELDYHPTGPVKTALGFPPVASRKGIKYGGFCFHASASEGGYREIFIHPELTDIRVILGTLTHEIGHAVLADSVGHRKPFRTFCEKVGFEFQKAEHACDGADWWRWAKHIADELGAFPHKRINLAEAVSKKQTTRMLLLECPCCEAKVRASRGFMTAIHESTEAYIARCMNPSCDGEIDFELLLAELDEGSEEE